MAITAEQSVFRVETTGFVIEAGAGIAAIALAIIGFSIDPTILMSIAGIVLGSALFAQGVAIASEYKNLMELGSGSERLGAVELGGGLTVEMMAGAAAIVLGILALIGYYPATLMSIADITVGAALVLSAGGLERLNTLKVQIAGISDIGERIAKGTASGAIAAQVLAGGAAVVLGILSLTNPAMATVLTLVGFLVLGAALAVNGAAFTGRMFSLFRPGNR